MSRLEKSLSPFAVGDWIKEISPGCSLEGLMLKLKLQNWSPDEKSPFLGKDPKAGKD